MNEIVKVCKIHGELTQKELWKGQTYRTSKKRYTKYLTCKYCKADSRKKYLEKLGPIHKERAKWYTMKYELGITKQEYNKILKEQNYVCGICKKSESSFDKRSNRARMLAVDHCHETNSIRGLLCYICNISLGGFRDSIDLLQKAQDYLKKYK